MSIRYVVYPGISDRHIHRDCNFSASYMSFGFASRVAIDEGDGSAVWEMGPTPLGPGRLRRLWVVKNGELLERGL